MINIFFWYFLIGAILFLLALLAAINLKPLRLFLSTILFFVGLGLGYVGLFSLTGVPQPVWLMIQKPMVREALVLGSHVEENVGIYVLLMSPDIGPKPIYYWFPYSKKLAESLEKAQREGKKRGQNGEDPGIVMQMPFEDTLDDRPGDGFFHPVPQPKTPDKPNVDRDQYQVPNQPRTRQF